MKRKFILWIFFAFPTIVSLAQCPPNGIETNPASPVNTQRPSKINTFNWIQSPFALNAANTSQSLINSPFYTTGNAAILQFYDPPDGYRDMLVEGGWELIKRDLGFLDNGTPRNQAPEVIYYMLYNKYTSILRVFAARSGTDQLNGAHIDIRLDNLRSLPSVLDLSAPLQALSDFSFDVGNVSVLRTTSQFLSSSLQWYYADFPMMYDPCMCLFESGMIVQFFFTNTGNISLSGNSTGTIVSQGAQEASTVNTQTFSLGDTRFGKVVSGFKSIAAFESVGKLIADTKSGNPNTSPAITDLKNASKLKAFFRTGLSAISYVKDAISIFDMLFAGGRSDPGSSQVELMPMTINLNTTFSGTLNFAYEKANATMRVPGSKIPAIVPDEEYPYYNEALGSFNIVKKPRIVVKQYTFEQPSYPSPKYIRISRIKLAEPIQYVLNPAAKLDIMEVNISIIGRGLNILVQTVGSSGPLAGGVISFDKINNTDNEYRTEYHHSGAWGYYSKYVNDLSAYPDAIYGSLVIKVVVQLRRKDAINNSNIQDIMWVNTYPIELAEITGTNDVNEWNAFNSVIPGYQLMPGADVDAFCNSTTGYKTVKRNLAARYYQVIDSLRKDAVDRGLTGRRTDVSLFTVSPNPARSVVNIEYVLKERTYTRINLLDATGRIRAIVSGKRAQDAGYHNSTYQLPNLPPGTYIIHLVTAMGTQTRMLLVVR